MEFLFPKQELIKSEYRVKNEQKREQFSIVMII